MPQSTQIKVMASVAFRDAYLQMQPAFERASGCEVLTQWALTVEILRRIGADEKVDLVLMSHKGIAELTRLGKIVPGSAVPFVKSGVGIATRAGNTRPDVSSTDAFKRSLLAARSVAYSSGPSGDYLAGLFESMGIAAELKHKLKIIRGEPVAEVVARGEAEIGFQQIAEILPVKGIQYLGPLPPQIQYTTVFVAGLHAAATQVGATRAWVKFLTTPEAGAIYKQFGMEPG